MSCPYKIQGLEYGVISGHIKPEFFLNNLKYEPLPSDIILSSYPKCGTTWTQLIVYLILNDLKPPTLQEQLDMRRKYYLEFYLGKENAEKLERPCCLKSHLNFHMIPYNSSAKYIYAARNPFDCCLSLHKFITGMKDYHYNKSFDEFFLDFMDGENCHFGDYFEHVLSWYSRKDDVNVLIVLFEQLKEDPKREIRRIGEFLGGRYASMVQDEEKLEKIFQLTKFESMKKADNAPDRSKLMKNSFSFFSSGTIGNHKNVLSDRQYSVLLEKYNKKFKATFLFDIWRKYI